VPPLEMIALVVFVMVPMPVAVTSTIKKQVKLAGADPPDKSMLLLPDVAATVPPHVLTRPFGVEITRPAGRVSVKPIPVNVTRRLVFTTVKVRLVLP
jgi:hypothetical protein